MVQWDDQDALHEHPGPTHQEVPAGDVDSGGVRSADQTLPQQVPGECHLQVRPYIPTTAPHVGFELELFRYRCRKFLRYCLKFSIGTRRVRKS